MSHTYTQNTVHLVFSTKDRPKLIPREFKSRLCSYLAGICKQDGIFIHAIDGMEDHVHLLIQIPATLALAKSVNTLKSNSSKWANDEGFPLAWQKGYAAFSVSASNIPAVVRYIRNQESHHRKMNFETEFLALLKKHNVEFDPKFVFGWCRAYGACNFFFLLTQSLRTGLTSAAPPALYENKRGSNEHSQRVNIALTKRREVPRLFSLRTSGQAG